MLVGVTHTDDPATAAALASKVHELRILDGERSAADAGAPLLVVSQFTLYARHPQGPPADLERRRPRPGRRAARRGRRGGAAAARRAGRDRRLRRPHALALVNDGPVTLLLET